jgi:hypothetical protein
MAAPIVPAVNSTITIQPLATTAASQYGSAPQALQGLAAGTLIEGFVVNRDAQQNPILRTSLGDILIKSEIFLKTGSDVVVRVDPTQPSLARIITIDGLTPADYALQAQAVAPLEDTIFTSALLLRPPAAAAAGEAAVPASVVRVEGLLVTAPKQIAELLPAALQSRWNQIANLIPPETPLTVTITAAFYPPAPAAPIAQTTIQPLIPQPFAQALPSPAPAAPIAPGAQAPPAVSNMPVIPSAPILSAAPAAPTPAATTPGLAVPSVAPAIPPAAPPATTTPAPALAPPATLLPGILSANQYTAPAMPATPQNLASAYPQPFAPVSTGAAATEVLPWLRVEATRLVAVQGQGKAAPAITPSVTPTAAPSAPAQHLFTNLKAEVIGHEPGGGNFVQTALGTLYIKTAQALPVGTELTLTLTPQTPATLPAPLAPLLPESLSDFTSLATDWRSLKHVFTTLSTLDPALAAALAERILPKPHAKLTNEMLFFLAAVKKGDVGEWMGRRARDLLAERAPETLDKFAREFLQLQQAMTEPKTQGWTGLVIPFLTQGQLQQIRLYLRQDEASGGKRGASDGQRFIIDLDLSSLGDLQLDGFIKAREMKKEFDLIIRSARHLPADITQGIRQIFETSLSTTGMQGYVSFQEGREHFLAPLSEARGGETGGAGSIFA